MSTIYTYNGQILVDSSDGKWLAEHEGLVLPPLTIRVKLKDGASLTVNDATCTQVSSSPNIWDVSTLTTSKGNNWSFLLMGKTDITEVLGANLKGNGNVSDVTTIQSIFVNCSSLTSVNLFDTSSVTIMNYVFGYCTALTSVPLFNTSNVTTMSGTFYGCSSLTSVPLFDTSSVTDISMMLHSCTALTSVPLFDTAEVTNMSSMLQSCTALTSVPLFNTSNVTKITTMLKGCTNVESGALALYQQASTQTTPPSSHANTFQNCGSNTTTGAAELAQIPSSWGGTGA